ncbi:MAG: hypothetical protein ABI311_03600 [Gemmatimonadaceae bacterium]
MEDRDRVAALRHVAHEVRNALNGVAVNLEVARGRARRGTDVTELTPFLDTAVQQLESVAELYKQYTVLVAEVTDRTTTASAPLASSAQTVKP